MPLHAYRNIGFSFTESEMTCLKWRRLFTDFDPAAAQRAVGVEADETHVRMPYFGRWYRLRLADGVLEKETEGGDWTEDLFMNEALVVYHALGDVQEHPALSGRWIPENELDPVKVRSGNRTDPMLEKFASEYAGRLKDLGEACESLGGTPVQKGDAGWEFRPMPWLPIRLIFWDADEEFPASVQALADANTTQYMHFEAVGCMFADLLGLIEDEIRRRACVTENLERQD